MDSTIVHSKIQAYLALQEPGLRRDFLGSELPGDPQSRRAFLQLLVALEKDEGVVRQLFDLLEGIGADSEVIDDRPTRAGATDRTLPPQVLENAPTGPPVPVGTRDDLGELEDPDSGVRLTVLLEFRAPQGADPSWVDPILDRLGSESSAAVLIQMAEVLGRVESDGLTPLQRYLLGRPVSGYAPVAEALHPLLDHPVVLARVFQGLDDPHRRSLARLLEELAMQDPEGIARAIRECLYLRVAATQRVGLIGLLELPEEIAVRILSEFPQELTASGAEDTYQEVQWTFQLRRFLKKEGIPYFPLRCLGGGGMGEVFLSQDLKRPPRLGALKFLRAPASGGSISPDTRTRFEREARVPLLLNHPGVVRVFDLGETEGFHWIDMDYIQGETLTDRLRREGRIPWREAVQIARELGDVLDYLERNHITHRDLKPSNLFLGRDPQRVILGDFGLVRLKDEAMQKKVPHYEATTAAVILGTVGYMPPEQATGGETDHRSDLFSLGVIFYACITGGLPYPGRTLPDYVRSLTRTRPPDRFDEEVPRELVRIIMKLLEPEPQDRYDHAREVLQDLDGIESGSPVVAAKPPRAKPATTKPAGAKPATAKPSTEKPSAKPSPSTRTRIETPTGGASMQTQIETPTAGASTQTRIETPTSGASTKTRIEIPDGAGSPRTRTAVQSGAASEFLGGMTRSGQAKARTPSVDTRSAKGAGRSTNRVVCKSCQTWFNDRESLEDHQRTCEAVASKGSPDPGASPPLESGQDPDGPLVCRRCESEFDSVLEGCLCCRFARMPTLPKSMSYLLLIGGGLLVAPLLASSFMEIDPGGFLGMGDREVGLGLAFLWLGFGIRRSQNWAYMVTVITTVTTAIVGILVCWAWYREPSAVAGLDLDVTQVRWVFGTSLALLVLALGFSGRRNMDHFLSNWTGGSILSSLIIVGILAVCMIPSPAPPESPVEEEGVGAAFDAFSGAPSDEPAPPDNASTHRDHDGNP